MQNKPEYHGWRAAVALTLVLVAGCGLANDGGAPAGPPREPAAGGGAPAEVGTTETTPEPRRPGVDGGGAAPSAGEVMRLGDRAACVSEARRLLLPPLAMYVMLDSSGSMAEPSGTGLTKSEAARQALRSFAAAPPSSELSMGLQFFPLLEPGSSFTCTSHDDCGPDGGPCFLSTCLDGPSIELCRSDADCPGEANSCVVFGLCENSNPDAPTACAMTGTPCEGGLGPCVDFERSCTQATTCEVSSYATPAVEIRAMPEGLLDIDAALAAREPVGLSPTEPALQGAIDHARQWALTHPEQTAAVVLATDGLPTTCGLETAEAATATALTSIAAAGLNHETPVRTFVIAVLDGIDPETGAHLDAIAEAGGTRRASRVDASGDVNAQFLDALRVVSGASAECRMALGAVAGLDLFRADISFDDGSGASSPLAFVSDRAGCQNDPAGWYYDVHPSQGTPGAIEICPQPCERFQAAPGAALLIELGCR